MIYEVTPHAPDGRLGAYLNKFIEPLPDDAWVCFRDPDTMWPSTGAHKVMYRAIEERPGTLMFTCLTNRAYQARRCYKNKVSDDPNILNHARIARKLERGPNTYKEYPPGMGGHPGHLHLFPKRTWERCPFDGHKMVYEYREGESPRKGVSAASFSYRWTFALEDLKRQDPSAGPVLCIQNLYIFHMYRMGGNIRDTSHFPREVGGLAVAGGQL